MTDTQRKLLYLIRGLSGSGKTTLAKILQPQSHLRWAADDYFTQVCGTYTFKRELLGRAHEHCQAMVELAMGTGEVVCVHNTFSQRWELEPYYKLAEQYGYSVFVIECQNSFQNEHDVPPGVIDAMRQRWERIN